MQLYSHFSVGYYCELFGKSRQAYYEQRKAAEGDDFTEAIVLKLVAEIRKDLPRCGVDKLHYMLQQSFIDHRIKLGRDGLYRLLGTYGLLIRHRKRRPYTTNSNHHYKKYPNLIREMILTQAGQLWVSDITYIRIGNEFCYLSIITDGYSHKIVGYKLHLSLHSEGAIDALIMANKDVKKTDKLIHHSDRGTQYCCHEYVKMITHFGIQLSMTENGDPYENAIAERVNGILKYEHGLKEVFVNYEQAKKATDIAIKMYNEKRIHDSCNRLTPACGTRTKRYFKEILETKSMERQRNKCRIRTHLIADLSTGSEIFI